MTRTFRLAASPMMIALAFLLAVSAAAAEECEANTDNIFEVSVDVHASEWWGDASWTSA